MATPEQVGDSRRVTALVWIVAGLLTGIACWYVLPRVRSVSLGLAMASGGAGAFVGGAIWSLAADDGGYDASPVSVFPALIGGVLVVLAARWADTAGNGG
jgi:uncharacterized membrane protein YeaQ/YmgE (transglycosylase-associated protein family)